MMRDCVRRLAEVTLLLSLAGQLSPERNSIELSLITLVTIAAAIVSDARVVTGSAAAILAVLAVGADGPYREIAYFGLQLLPLVWLSTDLRLAYLAIALTVSLKGNSLLDALPQTQQLNAGSLLFLLTAWAYLLVRHTMTASRRWWVAAVGGAVAIALVVIIVGVAQRDGVATGDLWSDPLFRFSCVAALTLAFARTSATRTLTSASRRIFPSIVAGVVVAAVASWFLRAPVRSVAFDDTHGRWERTDLPFDASEFGRDTTYNYRLLREASSRWGIDTTSLVAADDLRTLLQTNADDVVLVMKTPTVPYEADLIPAVRSWVDRGGVVVAISDHTDLLGMSQHLNALLPPTAGAFDYTALFDRRGFLNRPTTTVLEALLGTPSAVGSPRLFQTGTSFRTPYWNSAVLMTTGLSYREPADYTAENRFGSFRPELALRYGSEAATAIVANRGGGAWILVGDSTPWSNFSIYMPGYLQWWRGLLGAAEFRHVWRVSAVAVGILPLLLALHAVWPTFLFRNALGFIVGFVLASGAINHAASRAIADPSNVGLHLGPTAVVEFLEPMRPSAALNYSHLFSMLPRLGRVPRIIGGMHPPRDLRYAIIMHPDAENVRAADWAAYVRGGNTLVLIDDPINVSVRPTASRKAIGDG